MKHKRPINRVRAVLAATLTALLTLAALPALAMTNLIGTFEGEALVGKWFLDSDPCDKEGEGVPAGRGLYLLGTDRTTNPVSGGDAERERSGVWQTSFDGVATGNTQNSMGVFNVEVDVCGWLDRMAEDPLAEDEDERLHGIGAACGASKGFLGKGKAVATNVLGGPSEAVKLFDVGWKASAGGLLPVTGGFQEYTDATMADKKDKFGMLIAEVQTAGGGLSCLGENAPESAPDGAQTFDILGSFELINPLDPPDPKDNSDKECKGTGPDTKDHAFKPDPERCKDGGPQKD